MVRRHGLPSGNHRSGSLERCLNRRQRNKARVVLDEDGNVLRPQGAPSTPRNDPGAFILSRLLVCGTCGAWMSGFLRPHGRQKVSYSLFALPGSRPGCVRPLRGQGRRRGQGRHRPSTELLASDRQEWLRATLKEQLAAGKADERLASLRKRVPALTADLARLRQRLGEVDKEYIEDIQVCVKQCKEALKQAEEHLPTRWRPIPSVTWRRQSQRQRKQCGVWSKRCTTRTVCCCVRS